MGGVSEARICRVHGVVMEQRAEGLYCEKCERLSQHGHVIIAACPHSACGLGLLDIGHLISCYPSIKIGWRYADEALRDGDHVLSVSAVWGDHALHPETEIGEGRVLDLFCPWCRKELPTVAYCACGARMVAIRSRYDLHPAVYFCSRRGCPEHRKVRPEEMASAAGLQWMCRQPDHVIVGAAGARHERPNR